MECQQICKKPKLTKKLTPADKKILKALDKTVSLVDKYLENFQFGQATRQLYSFFWHDFCDLYIEKAKKQEDKKTKQILSYVLLSSLKLLHPFIPFVTEEIYQGLPIKNKKNCLIIEDWPK
jgi:valyl-tRNA synthetase